MHTYGGFGNLTSTTAFDPNGNKIIESVLNGTLGSAALTVTQTSWDPLNRLVCTAQRQNPAVFASLPAACLQSAGSAAGPDPITQLVHDAAGQERVEYRGAGTSCTANQTFDLDRRVLLDIQPDPGTGARPASLTTRDADGRGAWAVHPIAPPTRRG